MRLVSTLSVLLAIGSAEKSVLHGHGPGWSSAEASRKYRLQKPSPVEYDANEIDIFLFPLMDKLENMPLPDDPNHVFVRDRNKQLNVCEIPEDDDDSMESSANPDDVMDTVIRSFPDGKCAGRQFDDWYYQVCGNLAVKRSPFTISKKKGRRRVQTFKAFESLGVIGRDRKISKHSATVTDPRYVEQTYYEGVKCNVDGDQRRVQTTVTFECNSRFVAGYVHINDVVEEHPCKYRLQLQSADFCDNKWLLGAVDDDNSIVRCRVYFHPERVKTLLTFLDKFDASMQEKKARQGNWMKQPENYKRMVRELGRPDGRERMEQWARASAWMFDKHDVEYGMSAERERNQRTLDYVLNELTWASMNREVPYSDDEKKQRAAEEAAGHADDRQRLISLMKVLDVRRDELLNDETIEWYGFGPIPYTELLQDSDIDPLLDLPSLYLHFYASWLEYIKYKEAKLARTMLIAPNRKPPTLGTFLLLDNLIKSPYADSIKDIVDGLMGMNEPESHVLYDGEIDESDLEDLAMKFMKVYKEAKKGSDSLLFDLMDDEDFEY